MRIDFVSSFNDVGVLTDPIDSIDYRNVPSEKNFLKPGPLLLKIHEADEGPVKRIEVVNALMPAAGQDPIEFLQSLSAQQRQKLIRVYDYRLSTCDDDGDPNNPTTNNDDCPLSDMATTTCVDPADLTNVDWENGPPTGLCSYFYYFIIQKPNEFGTFNTETGQINLPVTIQVLNPSHRNFIAYTSEDLTNSQLDTTLTTQLIDEKTKNGEVLVPDPAINSLSISQTPSFSSCPSPWDPANPAQKPEFSCYLSPGANDGEFFIHGIPLVSVGEEPQTITFSMIARYSSNTSAPDYVPFYLQGGQTWVAWQGTLEKCANEK